MTTLLLRQLAEYEYLREQLQAEYQEADEDTLRDTLEGLTTLPEALASIVRSYLDDLAIAAALGTRISAMQDRLARIEQRAEKKRAVVTAVMERADMRNLAEPDFTATLRAVPPGLVVSDERQIPETYWKPQPPKLDRRALLATLTTGQPIPGRKPRERQHDAFGEDQVMPFSDSQVRMLAGKLNEKHVRSRDQRGTILSYIEGWHAIDEANRVFGFDGWDRETVWAECLWQDVRASAKACAYAARVRIRVRAGDTVVVRDGSGIGQGTAPTVGEAHEKALKEAETDATKRALTTFGNLFGLALYDKEQNGVRRRPKPDAGNRWVSWVVLGPNGELLGKHDTPEGFCSGLREAIAIASTPQDLETLWGHNGYTLGHLRTYFRDLKTEKGVHYTQILARLYRQRRSELGQSGQVERREGDSGQIDKSELALSTPKRVRDEAHLRNVASFPCLICARTPSYAHHLRFAQPRSMGSKVSDEWTVPLCVIHHRALHDAGNEEQWWQEHGIDAKAEAEKLWTDRHGESAPAVTAPAEPPLPMTGSDT